MFRKTMAVAWIGLLWLFAVDACWSQVIPRSGWKLKYVDSQELVGEDGRAVNSFDGSSATIWHTQWASASPGQPHEIQIDLGASYSITGLKYLPRQDGSPNGRIRQYEVYVSADGSSWGSVAASGSFANSAAEKTVSFTARTGRYIRLRSLSEVNNNPWTSAAEINVLGTLSQENQAPNGVIDSPSGNVTITAGESVTFSGTGTDPDNNLPLTYRWNFGTGSGVSDSTLEDPGSKQFNTAGTFTVTFTVTDSLGLSDPTPATRTVTVQAAGNQAPNGVIDSPSGNVTITAGQSVTFSGTGTDPDNNLPLTYRWNFGTGSGIADSTLEDPGSKQFNTAGTFTVTFTVTDSLGLSDPTPATRTVTVQAAANQAPNGVIDSPSGNVTITAGESVTFSGTGTDPDNNLPLTYRWNFGTGSGVSDSTLEDPGSKQFNTAGTFTVTFTVTDSLGLSDPTPATRTVTVQAPTAVEIPRTRWSLYHVDSQELVGEDGRAVNSFDGSSGTFWHTQWASASPGQPHEIQINLGGLYSISSFRYLPRQDGSPNGRINGYEFYVSTDGSAWGSPVATGTFANSAAEKTVSFTAKNGQFVRLRSLSEVNGNPWTSMAEIRVFGVELPSNHAPDGVITSPAGNLTISVGGEVNFSGTGTDPDGDLPLSYLWSFGTGSGVADSTAQNPGSVRFNTVGTHTVTLTVKDSLGLADPTPAVVTVTVTGTSSNQAPDGVILTPSTNLTINAGDSVYFTGSGSDPDNHQPLTFRWTFGAGSGVSDSASQNPGLVAFNNPGAYTVLLTVTDGLGQADATPATRTVTVQSPAADLISQDNWSVRFVDSQELVGENGAAANIKDGNPSTLWHTMWQPYSQGPPHEIQLDLGGLYRVSGFRYLPRQDGGVNGRVSNYELYVSTDGEDWGSAVSTGTFANSSTEKQVTFASRVGQFVRFRSVGGDVNGNPWASAAELRVVGVPVRPSLRIVTPLDYSLQTGGNLLVRANAALNASAQSGWGVRFLLDGGPSHGGRVMDRYVAPFETTFTGVGKADHVVEAVLIDSAGNEVSTMATRDQSIRVGVGDFTVAMGDSITAAFPTGFGDNLPGDDSSLDGRNFGGGYVPVLNNLLTAARGGVPQTIINHGLGGAKSSYGASLAPVLVGRYPDAQRYLILYGMNDANPLLPVPSGKGLKPGDSGYPGSFKDNVQRMVSAVKGVGKAPTLAKINIALGDCNDSPASCPAYPDPDTGARNVWIKEYNRVIDELAADPANNITVPPPDLYSYFLQTYAMEYFDNFHPNGDGYRSVARLWCQALTGAPCQGE